MCTVTNTALFKLYTHIYPKSSKSGIKRQAVYLFIYPENVRAITLRMLRNTRDSTPEKPRFHYSLSFSMVQEPCLVFTKGRVLESKNKTKAHLDLIKALAGVTDLTLEIHSSSATKPAMENLELLASSFSLDRADNRPCTDAKHADLSALYAGDGGQVVNVDKPVAHVDAVPPPYTDSTPSPRQASSSKHHLMTCIYIYIYICTQNSLSRLISDTR